MSNIIKLLAITTLLLSFALPVVAEQIKENKADINVLGELKKENEVKIKVLEERIKGNDERTSLQIKALNNELILRTDALKERMNTYFAFAGMFIAIISFLGYKTITKWIKQTIEDKTNEEIEKNIQKIEELLREKGENAVERLLSELMIKGKKALLELENVKTEYENSLNNLKRENIQIYKNKHLPNNTTKELEKFVGKLYLTKTEEKYSVYDWIFTGVAEYEKGEFDKAIISFTKAIELNPKFAEAYGNRGLAYFYREEYEKAIEDYKKAIELNPKLVAAYLNRGSAYGNLKKYEKAIEDYNMAIELNPKYAEAYGERGLAYFYREEYEKAIEDYKKAIELNPKYAPTYNDLSETYIVTGRYKKAFDIINKSLPLSRDIKDMAIYLYLKCISEKLLNMDTSVTEAELNTVLNQEFVIKWSFDNLELWLKKASIPNEAKTFIFEKTELLKKQQGI